MIGAQSVHLTLGYLREPINRLCTEQSRGREYDWNPEYLCKNHRVIIICRTGSSTDVVFCLFVYIAVRKPTNLN